MTSDRTCTIRHHSTVTISIVALVTAALSFAAHAQTTQQNDSPLLSDDMNPSYGIRNPNAASFMLVPPEQDNMFYMLNLMTFREKAEYADERETDLTGEEAGRLYNPMPEVQKVGGGIVYAGSVESQLAGKEPTWDRVGIVMYPSRRSIMQMTSSANFQGTAVHKGASLAASQIMLTIPDEAWKASYPSSNARRRFLPPNPQ